MLCNKNQKDNNQCNNDQEYINWHLKIFQLDNEDGINDETCCEYDNFGKDKTNFDNNWNLDLCLDQNVR